MPYHNTPARYGGVTKALHWLTAALIGAIIPVGLTVNRLAQDIRDPLIVSTGEDFTRAYFLFSLHKTLGVTIFIVALVRIIWAFFQPGPGLLNPDRAVEAFAARTVHRLLYGSLVLVPLTGWIDHAATSGFAPIRWPFGQSLPFIPKDADLAATFAGLHKVLQRVLVIAVAVHVAGALKHHLVDRDATLRRMLPGQGAAPAPRRREHAPLGPLVAALAIWGGAIAAGLALGTIPR